MQSKEFLEALNSYYKLKERYDDKYQQSKLKIINNPTYSLKEKQIKFKQLKKECINCKKDGGTIFTNIDGKLKAVCGHIQNPCNLNIEIDKGDYRDSGDLAYDLKELINNKKVEIIKTKLDFLFGYISEEEALAKFNALKDDITKKHEKYREVEVFYLNIVDNKEKNDLIKAANLELYEEIQKIKDYCHVYSINYNKALLTNAVEAYVENIIPLVSTISDLEYVYRTIDKQDGKPGDDTKKLKWMERWVQHDMHNVLIEKAYTLVELEYPLKEGKIIFNKK